MLMGADMLVSDAAIIAGVSAFGVVSVLGLACRLALSGPRHRMLDDADPDWGETRERSTARRSATDPQDQRPSSAKDLIRC